MEAPRAAPHPGVAPEQTEEPIPVPSTFPRELGFCLGHSFVVYSSQTRWALERKSSRGFSLLIPFYREFQET